MEDKHWIGMGFTFIMVIIGILGVLDNKFETEQYLIVLGSMMFLCILIWGIENTPKKRKRMGAT